MASIDAVRTRQVSLATEIQTKKSCIFQHAARNKDPEKHKMIDNQLGETQVVLNSAALVSCPVFNCSTASDLKSNPDISGIGVRPCPWPGYPGGEIR